MRFLIIDDHELIRSAVKNLLSKEFSNTHFTEVGNGANALLEISKNAFDIVIADLFLPDEEPFVLLKNIREKSAELPIIVLSASNVSAHREVCSGLGVSDYVNKGEAMESLVVAVKNILPEIKCCHRSPSVKSSSHALSNSTKGPLDINLKKTLNLLTDRQIDILTLVAQGKTNKEIARARRLSDNTIKVHVSAILKALKLNNRTQLSMFAIRAGLLKADR